MKKLLFSLSVLFIPLFFCSEEAEIKEVKIKEVEVKREIKEKSVFTAAKLFAQVGSIVVWIAIIFLVSKYGFDANDVGALEDSDFGKSLNLILYSTLSVFVGFYSYYLSENALSGKTTSKLGRFLSGFGALLFCSLSSFTFYQTYSYDDLSTIKHFFSCYFVTGLIGSLFTALLPWLTYKGVNRFIIK